MDQSFYENICKFQAKRISDLERELEISNRLIETYEQEVSVQKELIDQQREILERIQKMMQE